MSKRASARSRNEKRPRGTQYNDLSPKQAAARTAGQAGRKNPSGIFGVRPGEGFGNQKEGGNPLNATLDYYEGYVKALIDLRWWLTNSVRPLDKRYYSKKHLPHILDVLIHHADMLMEGDVITVNCKQEGKRTTYFIEKEEPPCKQS